MKYLLSKLVLGWLPPAVIIPLLPRSNAKMRLRGIYHYARPQLREDLYINHGEWMAYVGFYRSEYATRLAEMVGPSSELVLVEAHPKNYERLVKGLEGASNRERIHALNLALWTHRGVVPFEVYDEPNMTEFHKVAVSVGKSHYADSAQVVEVPCDSFDNVFERFPLIRHVFITINGAELEALRGMTKYLSTPGASVWIKSPFRNKETGEMMYKEVAQNLRERGLQVFVAAKTRGVATDAMGKVYAYRPWA